MFFTNLTLFALPREFALPEIIHGPSLFEQALSDHPLRSPGPLELETRGFVTPFNRPDAALSHTASESTLFALGHESRLLPASVLAGAIAERIAEHEAKTGRKPGKRMRNEFRELALGELLPRAFIKRSRTLAYFDGHHKMLAVDSASDKAAEDVCSAVREALGSFPSRPLASEASLSMLMSEWLISGNLPDGFEFGYECQLKDPSDQAAVVRCTNHDLTSEEVREHARLGKQVTQLGLIYKDRIRFVLDSKLKLRKLDFTDIAATAAANGELDGADPDSILDAEFCLMSMELRELISRLGEVLRFCE